MWGLSEGVECSFWEDLYYSFSFSSIFVLQVALRLSGFSLFVGYFENEPVMSLSLLGWVIFSSSN